MSEGDSDFCSIEDQQRDYFLGDLPKLNGGYKVRTGLNTAPGTIVLFQYRGHVVAAAEYIRRTRIKPDRRGYVGELWFDVPSIRIFDPVDAATMRRIWPRFDRFNRAKQRLSIDCYESFAASLKNVRRVGIRADDGSASGDSEAYSPDGTDSRESIETQIRARRGQQQFRDALRRRFSDHCVVTGCRVVPLLEAAHICPYRGERDNVSGNGLLLRADVHTLFDLNLIGIEPRSCRIRVHSKLGQPYAMLDGSRLKCARDKWPSQKALELRFAEFKERSRKPL